MKGELSVSSGYGKHYHRAIERESLTKIFFWNGSLTTVVL